MTWFKHRFGALSSYMDRHDLWWVFAIFWFLYAFFLGLNYRPVQ